MSVADPEVLCKVDGAVATLIFSNPARRNALTSGMSQAVLDALEKFSADDGIRAVVLRGADELAFMSGADIKEQADNPDVFTALAHRMLRELHAFEKPVIAMIHGYCLGGGVAVALQADIRLAADTAIFGVPAARLGIAYPWNSVGPLVSLVGSATAADILFTGRRLGADEANRLGLVQQVFPSESLEQEVSSLTETIAANAPLSILAAKAAIRAAAPTPSDEVLDRLVEMTHRCEASDDYREGQAAFHDRREPRFAGR